MSEPIRLAPRCSTRGRFLLLGLLFLALAGSAQAANVTVNCPASIQAAVNAAAPGDVITVIGTCTESVTISDHAHLTIQATTLGSATIIPLPGGDGFDVQRSRDINFTNLIVDGGGSSSAGIAVFDESQAVVTNCTVQDNSDVGVAVDSNSQVVIKNNSTIQGTVNGDGVDVSGVSSASIQNSTIRNNAGEGVSVLDRSSVGFSGTNDIANNGDTGVFLQDLSRVTFGGNGTTVFTTIEGNAAAGILVAAQALVRIGGGTKIRNNGSACPTDPTCGGIFAFRNSTVRVTRADISNNLAAGLVAQQGVDVGLSNTTVTNNAGDGVRFQRISIGDFITNNTFSGNGGAAIFCDDSSLVTGDVSAVPKKDLSCKQIDRANGSVRPGKVKEPK
jgi:parallel beta-helix repeat protein